MYGVDSQYSSSGPSVVLVCASLKEKALLRQPALLPIGEYKGFGMETKLCVNQTIMVLLRATGSTQPALLGDQHCIPIVHTSTWYLVKKTNSVDPSPRWRPT